MAWQSEDLVDMLNAVTGFGLDYDKVIEIGDRSWTLKHLLNLKMGLDIKEYKLPKIFLKAQEDGAAADSVPDMELMLKEFKELREFDEKGIPAQARLEKLGLHSYSL